MIDELEVRRLDLRFGTKSRVFQDDLIIVETPTAEWQIKITDREFDNICILHKNSKDKGCKYHHQRWESDLYNAYRKIRSHHRSGCVRRNKLRMIKC